MESILTSVKKMLGITEEYTHFDADLIMHINSVFMGLTQMGIGPSNGFYIEDDSTVWTDFVTLDSMMESVKSYMYMKVRMMFDPPASSSAMEAMNRLINEFEWRLNFQAELNGKEDE